MSNDLSRKRSRETAHLDNPPSLQPADATKLQKLRQDHRFTSKDKAIMTPRMEMKEDQQQREAHFQAQEELKKLAERKGFTSGEIALGKRVPRRYQKALGGGWQEAEADLQKNVKSYDQQLVRNVAAGIEETSRVVINQHAKKYKKLLGDDANPSQRDTESQYDQGASSRHDERYISDQHYESYSDDDAGSRSSCNEGYRSDERLQPIGSTIYFEETYAYTPDPGKLLYNAENIGIREGCNLECAVMILRDQGLDPNPHKMASMLQHNNQTGSKPRDLPYIFKEFNSNKEYEVILGIESINTLQKILDYGSPIASGLINDEGYRHMVVVDKIETNTKGYPTFVCIRDPALGPYKVRIDAWIKAWEHCDVVPSDALLASYSRSQKASHKNDKCSIM